MANYYADFTASGTDAGTSWTNAFDNWTSLESFLESTASAGDKIFIMGGQVYTMTSELNATANPATMTTPIWLIGVDSSTTAEPPVYADWASGADRPFFANGANEFIIGDYWNVFNIEFKGTAVDILEVDLGCVIYNVKSTNISVSSNRDAFAVSARATLHSCEGISLNGRVFNSSGSKLSFCWAHDSDTGINLGSTNNAIVCCVFDKMVGEGLSVGSAGNNLIMNNTITNCATGILGTSGNTSIYINNTISGCTTGASWTILTDNNFWEFNNFYGNTTDRTNVTAGETDTANDPVFTRARVEGTMTGGSTATIIDTGTNFVTSGVLVGDYVQNTTNAELSIITSITTTTNPNDTLNFSAMTTANANTDGYSISGDLSLQSSSNLIDAGKSIDLGVG